MRIALMKTKKSELRKSREIFLMNTPSNAELLKFKFHLERLNMDGEGGKNRYIP